ncbi:MULTISPECIES: deoxyribonuclease IV [Streptomyces]|uniref:Probable endonuclease 4 n=1 Tax=Streptomyces tsukubensis (strain DSM 42081 / NBRC 108919 / NRRL 18488 / 9993) TaxID=1114943 RepID=I2MWX8_STRT9|nr:MULTISPECIES: deoxyribonuclease IV [Streptomyces]AZK93675.1 endonuclease IV [Streptomyces tsukubensis]EIF89275.1 apurinic endonuclease Apn1 [Streptomyces tsukubensis NRRL18488]MYS63706.1 deoxyribonuclease IV [Streptomyces sp. SID5473]QKM70180.1 deoxyribonuclease IV [Streptomyces tsukubensis NRRL18488]TAI45841.1 deoxyribonuclease IV [Streptomyces tsukubensis]
MRNPVGGHVPVAGGLATNGLGYAREIGAEAVQVFVANPRGWAVPDGRPAQDEAFREECAAEGISPWIHAPYLINFGSHTEETARRSVVSMRHSLRRGREIGARGVVVHTGSATGGRSRETALAQVRELVLPLLDELTEDGDPMLLLEGTAGQGASLCSRVADFGPYFEALEFHPRLGVCLDTCHVYAAGHDLAAPRGMSETLDALVATVGEGRLRLIHANDSKEVGGSRKDRHENIGSGHIGADPFRELLHHPATEGVPLIIETPGGQEKYAADIALLKELRERGPEAGETPA